MRKLFTLESVYKEVFTAEEDPSENDMMQLSSQHTVLCIQFMQWFSAASSQGSATFFSAAPAGAEQRRPTLLLTQPNWGKGAPACPPRFPEVDC